MTRWLFALVTGIALGAHAQSAKEVHGSSDLFSAPGIILAWGIERGGSAAAAEVVVRVAVDAKTYPWLAVVGVDPFTKDEKLWQQAVMSHGVLDVRIPRAQIGDHPHTLFRLFASEAAARAGTPALVVYYHGVPDTTPEFATAAALDAHLQRRIAEGTRK
ncbi:MAG: hypothetical protein IT518_02785 [Burkholderiales bacterium]|nr:hypothetical protein [Burkholderiales bacterium]